MAGILIECVQGEGGVRALSDAYVKGVAELCEKEDIVFIGLVNWVEIWEKSKWEERLQYLKQHGEDIAQELTKMTDKNNG